MIEPNCDMPWDIYLDWLQDQGNEDLRSFDIGLIVSSVFIALQVSNYGFGEVHYAIYRANNSTGTGLYHYSQGDGDHDGSMGRGDANGTSSHGVGDDFDDCRAYM